MVLWSVASGISLIWHWPGTLPSFLVLVLGLIIWVGFLWFYWNGYSWTRYLAIWSSGLFVIDALFALSKSHSLVYLGAEASGNVYLNVLLLGFNLYLFSWLLTSEAAKYFSTDARHQRESLAAYRELGSPLLR